MTDDAALSQREAAEATRGSGVRLGAEVAGRALSLLTSFLIAVGLGVEGFGVYAAVSGLAVILAELGELGLQGTAQRALVAGQFRRRDMVRAKLALTAGLVLAAPLLVWGIRALFPALWPLVPDAWQASFQAVTRGVGLLVPFVFYFALAGWSEFLGVALRARGRRGQEAGVILCLRASNLAAVALVLARGGGLAGVAWAHVFSTILPVALGALLLRRAADAADAPARSISDVLRVSWPLAVNGGLALLSLRIELLVVFGLRGAREAGLFGAALKFVESLNAVPAAIAGGAMPALTREGLRGAGLVRGRTASTVALLAVPGALGLGLLAPGLAAFLGPGYEQAAQPLRILAPALVALFMNTVLLHALIAVGRAEALPRLTAIRVSVAALLAFALVPRFGVAGAAFGFLASELLLGALAWRACALARFAVPLAKPLVLALFASLPMSLAVARFGGKPVAAAALGAAIYGMTLAAAWRLAPARVLRFLGEGSAR